MMSRPHFSILPLKQSCHQCKMQPNILTVFVEFFQCFLQFLDVAVCEALTIHAAGCGSVDIELQVIDEVAFFWLDVEFFEEAFVDFLLWF